VGAAINLNFHRYKRAAETGHAESQFYIAAMYHAGEGVDMDYGEAVKWYRNAADQGHMEAQYYLGLRYLAGEGVDKDLDEAVKWIRKAAEQGHAEAQFCLGLKYAHGEGVPHNLEPPRHLLTALINSSGYLDPFAAPIGAISSILLKSASVN